ncbi:MAG: hypothetical protein B7Z61_14065, partial [Acidobacteria bacterium 37-71-11]
MSWELVEEHAAGLVALTGGASGPLLRALEQGGEEAAGEVLRRLAGIFGCERVAVEVQRHQRRGEEARNAALARLARAAGVRVVATQDALVAKAEDGPLADVLACIREHRTLDAAGRLLEPNRARRLRSPAEMARLFTDLPEAVTNTALVAEACPFRLHQLPYRFPSARLETGRDEAEELSARVAAGARERYREVSPKVRAQLDRELALIAKLGLSGYFLVVHDIVRFCRARGILAQGRGSAANSAVCYALAITAVDPVAMELLFERFLSEERGEWPDIDIDLPSGDLREEVIQHVYRTYGARGAAMTANVISYKRRSAIREVGKVLGFSAEHLGRLAALSGSWEFAAHVREELPEHLKVAGLAPEERRSRLRAGGAHHAPAAPPRAALRRHGAGGRPPRRRRAAGARRDAGARRHPVGQGRLRRPRHHQGGPARPRHAAGAAGRRAAHPRARGGRGGLRPPPPRRPGGLRHDGAGGHRRRLPDREPGADGDAAAHAPVALLRSRRRG